jgi:hypothetical protein
MQFHWYLFSCPAIPKRSQRQHAQVLTNSATANNRVLSWAASPRVFCREATAQHQSKTYSVSFIFIFIFYFCLKKRKKFKSQGRRVSPSQQRGNSERCQSETWLSWNFRFDYSIAFLQRQSGHGGYLAAIQAKWPRTNEQITAFESLFNSVCAKFNISVPTNTTSFPSPPSNGTISYSSTPLPSSVLTSGGSRAIGGPWLGLFWFHVIW